MKKRPDWDHYFMSLAFMAAARSTCDRAHVGCIIAGPDHHVLATGYNGSAPGEPHCDDVGHLMEGDHCKRTVHAERNAVMQARRRDAGGRGLVGATAYVSHRPCIDCAQVIVGSGISRIVFTRPYDDGLNIAYLEKAAVEVCQLELTDVLNAIAYHAWELIHRIVGEVERFAVGTEYRWRGKLWHVRAHVDEHYMVVRWWNRERRYWEYEVEDMDVMPTVLGCSDKPKDGE